LGAAVSVASNMPLLGDAQKCHPEKNVAEAQEGGVLSK
jgi:hypothetical protein